MMLELLRYIILREDFFMNKSYVMVSLIALMVFFLAHAEDEKFVQVAFPTKICFVGYQDVLQASDEWGEKVNESQKEFQQRALKLKAQEEELIKKSRQPGAVQKDLVKEQKDIQIEGESLQNEWQQLYQELQVSIGQKIDAAIERVEKAQGWDGHNPKMGYVNPKCDITQAVIEDLNKVYKKEKAAKKFKKEESAKPVSLKA